MIAALGGPGDFVDCPTHYQPNARERLPVQTKRPGWVSGMATCGIGLAVVELGVVWMKVPGCALALRKTEAVKEIYNKSASRPINTCASSYY